MGYKVTREARVVEQLELCDKDGNATAVLDIDIAVDTISKAFNKAYNDAISAQQKIAALGINEEFINSGAIITDAQFAEQEKALELYGEAVISMFNLIFGEENTKQLLDFYENRYVEMSNAIFPFIINVVEPAVERSNVEQRKILINNYHQAKRKKKKNPFKRK